MVAQDVRRWSVVVHGVGDASTSPADLTQAIQVALGQRGQTVLAVNAAVGDREATTEAENHGG